MSIWREIPEMTSQVEIGDTQNKFYGTGMDRRRNDVETM